MPTYIKKSKTLTEEQVKKVILDHTEVNTNCPESVRKYGERCEIVEELYNGYKNYMKIVGEKKAKPHKVELIPTYQIDHNTMEKIERLVGYKDEYIG